MEIICESQFGGVFINLLSFTHQIKILKTFLNFKKNIREYYNWFGLGWFLLFNGISTLVGYLMPKLFSKNSRGTI